MCLIPVEHVVLVEGSHRHDAGHHIQQERPEVADQGDNQHALRELRGKIVLEDAEAVPDVLAARPSLAS